MDIIGEKEKPVRTSYVVPSPFEKFKKITDCSPHKYPTIKEWEDFVKRVEEKYCDFNVYIKEPEK